MTITCLKINKHLTNEYLYILFFIFTIWYSIELYPKEYFFIVDKIYLTISILIYSFAFLSFLKIKKIGIEIKIKLLFILLLLIFLFFSYNNMSFENGGIVALPLILFSYTYHLIYLNKKNANNTIISLYYYFVLIFCGIPVILFIITKSDFFIGYYTQTFQGFSSNRNAFSYLSGIFILISLIERKTIYYLLSFLLFLGILFAESRAVLIALLISSFIYFLRKQKKIVFKALYIIFFLCLVILLYFFYASFSVRISDYGDLGRILLVEDYLNYIKNNLLFGNGGDLYFEYYDSKIQDYEIYNSHNFIIHILSGYGIFNFIIYSSLIVYHVVKLNFNARIFWIYIYTIALFQPTVGLGFTSLHILISLISSYYNNSGLKYFHS